MGEDAKRVLEKAEELGALIEGSEVFRTYKELHERLLSDEKAKGLLRDHRDIYLKIRKLEEEGKPVEPEDKHALMKAQEKLHENALLQEYVKAQADFSHLINRVTRNIYRHIEVPPVLDEEEESGG